MEIKYPPMSFAPAPPWVPATVTQDQARSYAESTVKLNPHVYLSTQELYIEQEGQDPRIVSREDLFAALALLDASRPQLEPFDLERAKAGDPIITQAGIKARYVGHVPEAREHYRVVVVVDGEDMPWTYAENGDFAPHGPCVGKLLMAPQQKPQPAPMWASRHEPVGPYLTCGALFRSEEDARKYSQAHSMCIGYRPIEVKAC